MNSIAKFIRVADRSCHRCPAKFALLLAWGLLAAVILGSGQPTCGHDQIPGAPQREPVAIVGATVHPISGPDLPNATVLFHDGKITALAEEVEIPARARRIDAAGQHVYPGLIEAHCDLGLVEINSIRATVDSRETGTFNPNVRAAIAFNPDSELIPVGRAGGILAALSVPDGGLVSGRSSLMLLDGWNAQDMTLRPEVAMHVSWPRNADDLEELTTFFEQSVRYAAAVSETTGQSPQPRDLRLQAMLPVVNGKLPVIVSADSLHAIRGAIAFKQRFDLQMIIAGGMDALLCQELLRSEQIAVIVSGVYRNPSRRHSAYDEAYTLPQRLHAAGIPFCISAGGRFGANGIRNLAYNAATAAAYGLPEDVALRSITLAPAEILGISQQMGALAVGMDASLLITDGNILETPTQIQHAFIQGREVDLNSRHTQLYHKYSEKYDRLAP